MRAVAVTVMCLSSAVTAIGCVDRDPFNASDVAAADAFHAREAEKARMASSPPSAQTVRCRCDEEGNLHVHAPRGSTVRAAQREGDDDAEAEITVPERRPGTPIRQTVSLGFVGDGKLTQTPSHGGPWNVPDGLLPKHAHGMPDRPYVGPRYYAPARFYGYGGYGQAAYTPRGLGGNVPGIASPGAAGPHATGRTGFAAADIRTTAAAPPSRSHGGGGSYGGSPYRPR